MDEKNDSGEQLDNVEYVVGHSGEKIPSNQEELPGMQKSFWQRNGGTLVTLAILGLVIGGAIAVNQRRADNLEVETPEISTDNQEVAPQEPTAPPVITITPPPSPVVEIPKAPEPPKEQVAKNNSGEIGSGMIDGPRVRVAEVSGGLTIRDSKLEVTAARGEGRTHLARRAITEQLSIADKELSNEARVYAEDYLQKKYAPKDPLHPGSTITFTADQVNEAISAAQDLSPAQLQNLHQYSVLVNWPPI